MLWLLYSFATKHVMRQYAHLLTHFRRCSSHTVERVFTMMHDVASDCGRAQTLLQLPILNAFISIEQSSYARQLSKVSSVVCRALFS